MNKKISFLTVVVILVALFCSCSDEKVGETSAIEANISYDAVSRYIPGDNTGDNDESAESSEDFEPLVGDFTVKMKKYDYNNRYEVEKNSSSTDFRDTSIAILDITNDTNKNYTLTIKGKYLDEDGNVIKTETQTWEQFESGLQKYFLFKPGIKFDKFEYDITTEEFTGECWKNFLSLESFYLRKGRAFLPENDNRVEGLYITLTTKDTSTRVYAREVVKYVLFDEKGGVICTGQGHGSEYAEAGSFEGMDSLVYLCRENGGKFSEWPEQFRGNVTAIMITPEISEEVYEWWKYISITINE